MKQFLLSIACLLMFTIGCGKTEVAEQSPAPAPAPASNSGVATPTPASVANRDPRLEFNKLVQFLGTRTPRVYWLNSGISATYSNLDPKFVKTDGNYHRRESYRDWRNITMTVSNHDFDGIQNLGTVVWSVSSHITQGDWNSSDKSRYKATYYFSNEWSLQKVEYSFEEDEPFQVFDNNQFGKSIVTKFFQEAMKAALK